MSWPLIAVGVVASFVFWKLVTPYLECVFYHVIGRRIGNWLWKD